MLDRPICTLALADRDRFWFKSKQGVDATEMPRRMAFCEQTIAGDCVFVVQDAARDARFAEGPVVKGPPYVRFYAGAPLITPGGVRIGSLCVLDRQPASNFADRDRRVLTDLAATAVELLEARARQAELARCTDEIAHLARHDPLTGLANRRRLAELYDSSRTDLDPRSMAVLYLDLDGFKGVNDRRGHACGDALLRDAADRLRSCLPAGAHAARIGGDEFAILLRGERDELRSRAAALGWRIIECLRLPFDDLGIRISCSIGVVLADHTAGLDELLAKADAALYRAKNEGRGRCVFAEEADAVAQPALFG